MVANQGDTSQGAEPVGIRPWAVACGALLATAALTTFVVGFVLSSSEGGQTPKESYILTLLLAVLSVAAGWIIAVILQQHQQYEKNVQEINNKKMVDQNARSAARRIFFSLDALGRLQETVRKNDGKPSELRTLMRLAEDQAESIFKNTEDSLYDWEQFAPEAVADEISKAQQSGNNNSGGRGENG